MHNKRFNAQQVEIESMRVEMDMLKQQLKLVLNNASVPSTPSSPVATIFSPLQELMNDRGKDGRINTEEIISVMADQPSTTATLNPKVNTSFTNANANTNLDTMKNVTNWTSPLDSFKRSKMGLKKYEI